MQLTHQLTPMMSTSRATRAAVKPFSRLTVVARKGVLQSDGTDDYPTSETCAGVPRRRDDVRRGGRSELNARVRSVVAYIRFGLGFAAFAAPNLGPPGRLPRRTVSRDTSRDTAFRKTRVARVDSSDNDIHPQRWTCQLGPR